MNDADLMAALRSGAESLDRGERGPMQEVACLHKAGWLSDAGDLSPNQLCERLTQIGAASLPIARLYEGHANALALIAASANDAQRLAVEARLRQDDGGSPACLLGVWGADGARPVQIVPGETGQELSGEKAYASGLGVVTLAIVTAQTDAGLQMVLIDARDMSRGNQAAWDVDGMVGSVSGTFMCDRLPAGDAQQIGSPGAMLEEPAFHGGVWRLAACYAGAIQRLAVLCNEVVEAADASGRDNPINRARLGSVVIESQTATLWARHAAEVMSDPAANRDAKIAAALFAREACEQAADRTLALAERVIGARLHQRGNEAGRIARDLRLFLRQAALDDKLALATRLWARNRAAFRA